MFFGFIFVNTDVGQLPEAFIQQWTDYGCGDDDVTAT